MFILDLDNTLVYTNRLNNEAYNYALQKEGLLPLSDYERLTRDIVFCENPNLTSDQKKSIVRLKQEYFIEHIEKTVPNKNLFELLSINNASNCILWTNADKCRAQAILKYYNITGSFKKILYNDKTNVQQVIESIYMCCDNEDRLIFYEDDRNVIYRLKSLNLQNIETVFVKQL